MAENSRQSDGGHEGEDEKITVTVRLVEGGQHEFDVSRTALVRTLRERALAQFGIQPGSATYVLFLNNVRLDDGATLEAAGVRDESVLLLATEPQVGA